MQQDGPVRVAIVDDYDVVVNGVAAMLAPYADRVVVEQVATEPSVDEVVDVVLFDTFGQGEADSNDVDVVLRDPSARKVAIFSWNVADELVARARERGVSGYIDKSLTAEELVAAIERVHRGEDVAPDAPGTEPNPGLAWPGQDEGLTAREAEVLAFMVAGLRNPEITEKLYISKNSVKTHVRNIFRKVGADHRVQAVLWGIDHGFRDADLGSAVDRWRR